MRAGWDRRLFLLTLCVSTGCAATAPFNAPDTTFARHVLCAELEGGQLSPGTSCRTLINATSPANATSILIKEGERYRVCVARGHIWKDASIKNHPPCGSQGKPSMNMFASLKKASESDWFALMAEVSGHSEQIDICRSHEFKATHAGQLILYANDMPMFYWNNSGVIEVLITHLRDKFE